MNDQHMVMPVLPKQEQLLSVCPPVSETGTWISAAHVQLKFWLICIRVHSFSMRIHKMNGHAHSFHDFFSTAPAKIYADFFQLHMTGV